MLSDSEIDSFLENLTPDQAANILALRQLLVDCSVGLSEQISDGKWYRGLLIYKRVGTDFTIYALGPLSRGFTTFHMMPYYASAELQQKHGAALKPFLAGKSCIKFRNYADLPAEALRDIIGGGLETLAAANAVLANRTK